MFFIIIFVPFLRATVVMAEGLEIRGILRLQHTAQCNLDALSLCIASTRHIEDEIGVCGDGGCPRGLQ